MVGKEMSLLSYQPPHPQPFCPQKEVSCMHGSLLMLFSGNSLSSGADSRSWWFFFCLQWGLSGREIEMQLAHGGLMMSCARCHRHHFANGLDLHSYVYSEAERNMRKMRYLWFLLWLASHQLCCICSHLAAEQHCLREVKGQKQNCGAEEGLGTQIRWFRLASGMASNYQMADSTCTWKQAHYICTEITKWHYSLTFHHLDLNAAEHWHGIASECCFCTTWSSCTFISPGLCCKQAFTKKSSTYSFVQTSRVKACQTVK